MRSGLRCIDDANRTPVFPPHIPWAHLVKAASGTAPTPFVNSPALRVDMLPRDDNPHGTILGGGILFHMDNTKAEVATAAGCHRVVTGLMREVTCVEPVVVGDILSLYGEPVQLGNTRHAS